MTDQIKDEKAFREFYQAYLDGQSQLSELYQQSEDDSHIGPSQKLDDKILAAAKKQTDKSQLVNFPTRKRSKHYSIAASIALFSLVGLLVLNTWEAEQQQLKDEFSKTSRLSIEADYEPPTPTSAIMSKPSPANHEQTQQADESLPVYAQPLTSAPEPLTGQSSPQTLELGIKAPKIERAETKWVKSERVESERIESERAEFKRVEKARFVEALSHDDALEERLQEQSIAIDSSISPSASTTDSASTMDMAAPLFEQKKKEPQRQAAETLRKKRHNPPLSSIAGPELKKAIALERKLKKDLEKELEGELEELSEQFGPETWMKRIEDLLKQGKTQQAKIEFKRFRQQFPHYRVKAEIIERLSDND